MSEITFNSMQEFYMAIHAKGGATLEAHGPIGNFYAMMAVYTNPNTCSCKKGKNAFANIFNTCRSALNMSGEHLTNCRAMFDNQNVTVNESGREVTKF
jgi:hypothetical protein